MPCNECKWMTAEPSIWEPGVDLLCHYDPRRIVVASNWWCRHFEKKGTEDE